MEYKEGIHYSTWDNWIKIDRQQYKLSTSTHFEPKAGLDCTSADFDWLKDIIRFHAIEIRKQNGDRWVVLYQEEDGKLKYENTKFLTLHEVVAAEDFYAEHSELIETVAQEAILI